MSSGPDALAWTDRGKGGPTLLLIHGYGANSATWDPWTPELERHHRVVNIDLTGFGRAPRLRDADYRPAAQARRIVGLVRRLDLDAVVPIGHSLGGGVALMVALELLEARGGRLRGLVSVAGAAYPQPLPPFVRLARRPGTARWIYRLLPKGPLIRAVMSRIVRSPSVVTPQRIRAFADPLRTGGSAWSLVESARHTVPENLEKLAARYPDIDVPVLCLWGSHDGVVPLAVGRRLARELPDARLVVLDECGHLPVDERPHESLNALMDFLEHVRSGGPAR